MLRASNRGKLVIGKWIMVRERERGGEGVKHK